jgi:DNA polymerase III subunit delta
MDALQFLDKGGKAKKQPIYVVTGDEDFLKRRAITALQTQLLGDNDPSFALSTYLGDKADFAAIRSELDTLPFLSEYRLVIVEKADDRGRKQLGMESDKTTDASAEQAVVSDGSFVSRYRSALEKYAASPAKSGVLILEVKSWPANTKLAKLIPDAATIVGKTPAVHKLPGWCIDWTKTAYSKKLAGPASQLLVDLVGTEMGLLDTELEKLAVYVGDRGTIEATDVDLLVGRSRSANVFKIMDAVGDGKPRESLTILSELFEEGDVPEAILGALGFQIRKLALAARIHKQGATLEDAMDRANVAKWPQARDSTVKQLRALGWNRIDKLYDWLVECDQGMKGGSALPKRTLLERLVVRMARSR